jgi:hypothetical protein
MQRRAAVSTLSFFVFSSTLALAKDTSSCTIAIVVGIKFRSMAKKQLDGQEATRWQSPNGPGSRPSSEESCVKKSYQRPCMLAKIRGVAAPSPFVVFTLTPILKSRRTSGRLFSLAASFSSRSILFHFILSFVDGLLVIVLGEALGGDRCHCADEEMHRYEDGYLSAGGSN